MPTVPGSGGPLPDDADECHAIAAKIGYPIIIKAAAGGGGRGMRVVHTEAALINSIHVTKGEAKAAFGDDTVYMEKYLQNPVTLRCRSSPMARAMPFICTIAIAHCSGAIKSAGRSASARHTR